MAATLRDLARWSVKPAKNVDTATTPRVNVLRGLAARATTPLLPDDYLKLLNPLWSARELRGEVVDVRTETEDSATVTIKPGWGFSAEYQPGQYVGIGLRIDGPRNHTMPTNVATLTISAAQMIRMGFTSAARL